MPALAHSAHRPLDLPADGAVRGRRGGGAGALPLLGGLTLGGPGVDGGNLLLEGGVDEAVALEGVEALELRGDDEGGEGLTAAACECVSFSLFCLLCL